MNTSPGKALRMYQYMGLFGARFNSLIETAERL
jgi:hypothetical protein